jgi:hypothetical protein
MRDPLRLLAVRFLRSSSVALLALGFSVSLLQFVTFYAAAEHEGVLLIRGGVGFLNNFGLLATLAGNAVLFHLARLYYEHVSAFAESGAIKCAAVVEKGLSKMKEMVLLRGRFVFVAHGLALVGLIFWTANVGFHIFGDVQAHWGYKVFDSIDHPFGFYLNRLNNFYTWLIVLPICGQVMIFCTFQLVQTITAATDHDALKYDLLNPDGCGGFSSIQRAHVVLNVVIAIIYVQVTLHTETFARMNLDHILAYVVATLFLLFGNTIFLGGIRGRISKLKMKALNEQKDRVYRNDPLSLDVLRFFYEHQKDRFSFATFATKAIAVVVPAFVKAIPIFVDSSHSLISV